MEKHATKKKKSGKSKARKKKIKSYLPKIIKDKDGWVNAQDFKPREPYDLVELRDSAGSIRSGWWNGQSFETALKFHSRPWQFLGTRFWRKCARMYTS